MTHHSNKTPDWSSDKQISCSATCGGGSCPTCSQILSQICPCGISLTASEISSNFGGAGPATICSVIRRCSSRRPASQHQCHFPLRHTRNGTGSHGRSRPRQNLCQRALRPPCPVTAAPLEVPSTTVFTWHVIYDQPSP